MESQAPKKITKKVARLQVQQALSLLSDLELSLGKKKFKSRLQKVERILSQGLPKEKKSKKLQPESGD